jgi:hypothetical protein
MALSGQRAVAVEAVAEPRRHAFIIGSQFPALICMNVLRTVDLTKR